RYRRREGHPESLGPAPGSAPWLSGLVPRTRLFVRVPSREQDKQARNRHHDDPGKLRGQRESEREPRNEEAPPRGAVEVAAEQGEKESAEEGHTYVGGDQLSVRGDRRVEDVEGEGEQACERTPEALSPEHHEDRETRGHEDGGHAPPEEEAIGIFATQELLAEFPLIGQRKILLDQRGGVDRHDRVQNQECSAASSFTSGGCIGFSFTTLVMR